MHEHRMRRQCFIRMQNRMQKRICCKAGCGIVCIIEFCLCRASCPQIGGPSPLGMWPRKAQLCETVNNANAEPNAESNAYSNLLHRRIQIHVHNRILFMQSRLSTNRRALPLGKVAPESPTLRNIKQCECRTKCKIECIFESVASPDADSCA